jgi:hypothetical protein
MDTAALHRSRADDERAKAAETNLRTGDAMYLRSARYVDDMADAVDDTVSRMQS